MAAARVAALEAESEDDEEVEDDDAEREVNVDEVVIDGIDVAELPSKVDSVKGGDVYRS